MFTLNTETARLTDNLGDDAWTELCMKLIPAMLSHYAAGTPAPLTGNRVKFKDVPGGYAYEGAFTQNAIKPIEKTFGKKPQEEPKQPNASAVHR